MFIYVLYYPVLFGVCQVCVNQIGPSDYLGKFLLESSHRLCLQILSKLEFSAGMTPIIRSLHCEVVDENLGQ